MHRDPLLEQLLEHDVHGIPLDWTVSLEFVGSHAKLFVVATAPSVATAEQQMWLTTHLTKVHVTGIIMDCEKHQYAPFLDYLRQMIGTVDSSKSLWHHRCTQDLGLQLPSINDVVSSNHNVWLHGEGCSQVSC